MRRPGIGRALAVGLVAATLGALASLAPIASAVPTCAAAGANHAAVVVEHRDGSVKTSCVAFATTTVTGEQLLTLSGIAWSSQTFGFGEAVCALDGEPARYLECPGKDSYWAVFVASAGGSWRLANVGISDLVLRDGDAEGLRYVPAAGNPVAPVSPAGVCAAPAPAKPAPATAKPVATVSPIASTAHSSASTAPPPSASPSVEPTALPTTQPSETASASMAPTNAATLPTPTSRSADPPIPAPPGGPDSGLVAASVAGVALAGLAALGFIARRRRPR
jgi:hypothetical protein